MLKRTYILDLTIILFHYNWVGTFVLAHFLFPSSNAGWIRLLVDHRMGFDGNNVAIVLN